MHVEATPQLAVRGVSKAYGEALALCEAGFVLMRGECLALLGPNGAGKSTLIKVLAGVEQPSSGVIQVMDQDFSHGLTPAEAARSGLAFVHQNLGLIDDLTVAENIAMVDGYKRRFGLISWRDVRSFARDLLARWEIDVDPTACAGDLGAAGRALVAIARALAQDARVVVLDEPTAALPQHDVDHLLLALERVKKQGVSLIYVTHRLGEVAQIADRAVVLRNGRVVHDAPIGATSRSELVRLVIGADVDAADLRAPAAAGAPLLELRDVQGPGLSAIDFDLREGEIVALAGLVGAGQSCLGRIIAGALKPAGGTMRLHGRPYAPRSPRAAQKEGVVFLPEDRATESGVLAFDCTDNYHLRRRGLGTWVWGHAERRATSEVMGRWNVVAGSERAALRTLSGGNQQKLLLAKWLECQPTLLVAESPTSGVDVGARRDIYDRLVASAASGVGVVLVTPDAEEAAAIANRVLVFDRGTLVAQLTGERITEQAITAACVEGRTSRRG